MKVNVRNEEKFRKLGKEDILTNCNIQVESGKEGMKEDL